MGSQYSGHVTIMNQWEVSIYLSARDSVQKQKRLAALPGNGSGTLSVKDMYFS